MKSILFDQLTEEPMIIRGVAAFFGLFSVMNVLGGWIVSGFDSNVWWIDLSPLPTPMAQLLLLSVGVALLAFAAGRVSNRWAQNLTIATVAVVAVFEFWNVVRFYGLEFGATIHPFVPIPLSALVLTAMIAILYRTRPAQPVQVAQLRWILPATTAACAVVFPLLQMLLFGTTDYRRPADVAAVFGARTYADGRPSPALADRVLTACDLYRKGLVRRLILSGGPGDGTISEPQAMRRLAVMHGVPDDALLLDEQGLNTQATVRNTKVILDGTGGRRILVVSHSYHLPRVKMAFARQGIQVYTVPARQTRVLRDTPVLVCREVVAEWAYYVRPLL